VSKLCWRKERAAANCAWMAIVAESGGHKKRPSVETEGRLTIACHMKNLQKIDVVSGASLFSSFTVLPPQK